MKKLHLPAWIENNKENLIAFIVAAVLAFFFLVNSPIHLWRHADTGPDSSTFKTIALMMDKGYMPYKDTFDNKGPLLFLINYLGLKISYYRGVWVFEEIFMAITLFLLYKIARLKTKAASSALAALTAMSLLFNYFEGGNLTEEYAMPFIAIGVYIFLDYLLNDRISWYRIAISGISLGAVCMLRPNMITVWIVFCAAIFFRKIWEKDWKQLEQFVLWFLIGFSVMVIPFVIWLAANGALQACIEDYILFNFVYSSAEGGRATFPAKWSSFFTFASSTVYLVAFIGIAYHLKEKRFVNITYVMYLITSLFLLCMSGMTYGHYGMVLVPAVVYPLSLIMKDVDKLINQDLARVIKTLITVYLMTAVIVPDSIETIKKIPTYYAGRNGVQFDEATTELCQAVTNLTSEDDAISVYGYLDIVYVKTHRRHATQYSYQYPVGNVTHEIIDQYMEQLAEELPPVIVVQGHYSFYNMGDILGFLDRNGYQLVWPENTTVEDLGKNKTNAVFYRSQNEN